MTHENEESQDWYRWKNTVLLRLEALETKGESRANTMYERLRKLEVALEVLQVRVLLYAGAGVAVLCFAMWILKERLLG